MKKNTVLRMAACLSLTGLILSAGMGKAWAYFTTYASAAGGHIIEFGDETTVHEEFYSWTKHVTITSDADSEPVYVRAKAFAGSDYTLEYSGEDGRWTPGEDGYYYYSEILNAGESTSQLLVAIRNVPEEMLPGEGFNVVVVYESVPVRYDESGEPYADWDAQLEVAEVEGGAD